MSFDPERAEREKLARDAVRQMNKLPFGVEGLLMNILRAEGTRHVYFKSCITCNHFHENGDTWPEDIKHEKRNQSNKWPDDTCTKFRMKPPARVIANACEYYSDEDIPF